MNQLKTFFQDKSIKTILDIGTGPGQFVEILLNTFHPNISIVGIDPGKNWLDEARSKFPQKNIQFKQMGAEKLDFDNHAFDLASMSKALHHLPNIEKSFQEIKRVLKKDGWLIVAEMYSDNLSEAEENQKYFHHTKSEIDRLLGNYHHQTWKKNEILEIITKNGFEVATHFDHVFKENKAKSKEEIELWVNKIKGEIEKLKGTSAYESFLPRIAEFRQRISKNGLQSPTNIVVICQPK